MTLKLSKQSAMDSTTYVYLIAIERSEGEFIGPVKVGIAWNVTKRLSGIACSSPCEVGLIDVWEFPDRNAALLMERHFHESHKRVAREWFDIAPTDAKAFLDEAHSRREQIILTSGVVRKRELMRKRSQRRNPPAWESLGSARYFEILDAIGINSRLSAGRQYYRQKRDNKTKKILVSG